MIYPEQTNWIFDYGSSQGKSVTEKNFTAPTSGFSFSTQDLTGSAGVSVEIPSSLGDFNTKKRGARHEASYGPPSSKACREKKRRDKLNDKFMELGAMIEPGRPSKIDKAAILMDAVRVVKQLKDEAGKLKGMNYSLKEKIKELKAEKNGLRDEKHRLKAEKERLEQQVKSSNFIPMQAMLSVHQGQVIENKMVPVMSYPRVSMWQFMPPSAFDTSGDHVLHPPVA